LANVTLDDTTKFGIEWARFLSSKPPNAQEVTVMGRPPTDPFAIAAAATPQAGIRYSIVELGGRLSAAISAAASDDRLNVISSPHILASNNKEAKIQIGSSQPILTNTYTTPGVTGGTGAGTVEGTIEYKDIGTILTLTPRISDSGLITLEILVEQSDVRLTTLGGFSDSIPAFDKKIAKTVLSVLEGQTIVIGGLIENRRIRNKSGIPLLSRIPILGALFGTQNYEAHKTELVLLLTPHIITDHIRSRTVTDEFREKLDGLKKELEMMEKK
jgi:general secretion pathway protein D